MASGRARLDLCRRRPRVLAVVGTRPEAIKVAPVIRELREDGDFDVVLCSTGQHREMLEQALSAFELEPDVELGVMRDRQSLTGLTNRALEALDGEISRLNPDIVLVQGDTTSAMAGALAAYYSRVPVAHLEAGLRTADLYSPFPEEGNRRLIGTLAALHFAPTPHAARRLQLENVPERDILVTGNTVIDALLSVKERIPPVPPFPPEAERRRWRRRKVLVTMHRRESRGEVLERVCRAILELVRRNPEVEVIFPVHRSPFVRETVYRLLGDNVRIKLLEPLDYEELVAKLDACEFVLTDSGGLQEEAPALGKPVLVLRETTERPEAVEAGTSLLVGTAPERVLAAAETLLRDGETYRRMARARNPYGDGRASRRVAAALRFHFGLSGEAPAPFSPAPAEISEEGAA
ncbi:non-hydrolyzing UDP-N-acetylglucosamine 2-epimerase [Rubrobacter xylanophilus]|uniref:non-hydrolyzing UDP-N-acetylglucosamine 2-epimerase n=1 Tax=Rubrobacter xylanophilus TaxID=49319 RepID=UPI00117AC39C|nr:UDP-N-acetylglucosamine 2-epimerase (non-hydrolyzing) [Rubrobacter xylanophilus]